MTLDQLNRLPADRAREALARCCGARRWVEAMDAARPFASADALIGEGERVWQALGPDDWREAFAHHPRIGDVEALRRRFATTAAWAADEQRGAAGASDATLAALAEGNRRYEERFGHLFIVCATGKGAGEMQAVLERRLGNDPESELRVAAAEQWQITRLRLRKLLEEGA